MVIIIDVNTFQNTAIKYNIWYIYYNHIVWQHEFISMLRSEPPSPEFCFQFEPIALAMPRPHHVKNSCIAGVHIIIMRCEVNIYWLHIWILYIEQLEWGNGGRGGGRLLGMEVG